MNSSVFLQQAQTRVNRALSQLLSAQQSIYADADNLYLAKLKNACTYSISNGGKRLRPALFYATAQTLNSQCDNDDLDKIAAAIECIHSYSLVHDDLPAMDNDDLRRGKPTCHIAFDEATAILVGDGLQAFAFELLTQTTSIDAHTQMQLVRLLAQASGNMGMVGGQMIDLECENQPIDKTLLELMHSLKTGALIRASVGLGAISANTNAATCLHLDNFAKAIGLAFQVQDDILDIESDTATLGKTQGADIKLNKSTYPALMGLSEAKAYATKLITLAHQSLNQIEADCSLLHDLADFIVTRRH
jgi:geranylgeranyl pyrophosphate synthase